MEAATGAPSSGSTESSSQSTGSFSAEAALSDGYIDSNNFIETTHNIEVVEALSARSSDETLMAMGETTIEVALNEYQKEFGIPNIENEQQQSAEVVEEKLEDRELEMTNEERAKLLIASGELSEEAITDEQQHEWEEVFGKGWSKIAMEATGDETLENAEKSPEEGGPVTEEWMRRKHEERLNLYSEVLDNIKDSVDKSDLFMQWIDLKASCKFAKKIGNVNVQLDEVMRLQEEVNKLSARVA